MSRTLTRRLVPSGAKMVTLRPRKVMSPGRRPIGRPIRWRAITARPAATSNNPKIIRSLPIIPSMLRGERRSARGRRRGLRGIACVLELLANFVGI